MVQFIASWGSRGTENGQFDMPWDVAVDSGNNVFVPDYGNNRIQIFSNNGTYLRDWGTEERVLENLIIQQ